MPRSTGAAFSSVATTMDQPCRALCIAIACKSGSMYFMGVIRNLKQLHLSGGVTGDFAPALSHIILPRDGVVQPYVCICLVITSSYKLMLNSRHVGVLFSILQLMTPAATGLQLSKLYLQHVNFRSQMRQQQVWEPEQTYCYLSGTK